MRALWVCALLASTALAGENGSGARKITPELPPHPKVAKVLNSLGENTGALLPEAGLAGEFNGLARKMKLDQKGPRARDFSVKMAWAPDRKRAFFCGSNHGVPHKINDVWEYDLAANTWVLAYGPTFDSRPGNPGFKPETVKEQDGVLRAQGGGPLLMGHLWWALEYDPVRRAMLKMHRSVSREKLNSLGSRKGAAKKGSKSGGGRNGSDTFSGALLWQYYPYERRWEVAKVQGNRTSFNVPCSALSYVPELGGTVWWQTRTGKSGTLFPSKDKGQKDLEVRGGRDNFPQSDSVWAHDPVNRLIVAHGSKKETKRTHHYDIAKNTWTKVISVPKGARDVPHAHDANTLFGYDPVGKVCLIYAPVTYSRSAKAEKSPHVMWSYSAVEKKWTKLPMKGAKPPAGKKGPTGYFDPARNVFVLCLGRTVWVYRNKRAGK
jgi:hypothetical protein